MTTVLVVDDSEVDRRLIGGLLEELPGCTIVYAKDGVEALEQVRDTAPDVIVTDLRMPKLDGLELVKTIRKHHPATPIVLITAHGSEILAVEALKQGAAGYVPKIHVGDTVRVRDAVGCTTDLNSDWTVTVVDGDTLVLDASAYTEAMTTPGTVSLAPGEFVPRVRAVDSTLLAGDWSGLHWLENDEEVELDTYEAEPAATLVAWDPCVNLLGVCIEGLQDGRPGDTFTFSADSLESRSRGGCGLPAGVGVGNAAAAEDTRFDVGLGVGVGGRGVLVGMGVSVGGGGVLVMTMIHGVAVA